MTSEKDCARIFLHSASICNFCTINGHPCPRFLLPRVHLCSFHSFYSSQNHEMTGTSESNNPNVSMAEVHLPLSHLVHLYHFLASLLPQKHPVYCRSLSSSLSSSSASEGSCGFGHRVSDPPHVPHRRNHCHW